MNDTRSASPEVVFARSGLTVKWQACRESILDLAMARGLNPPHSCRVGGCNSCLTRLLEGEVEYTRDLLLPPPSGDVLICCCRPKTRVVIDA